VNRFTGGCACGAVRYEASGTPSYSVLCHCRDCQQASGTGHVPVMGMPKASFTFNGPTKTYEVTGSSGLKSVRHFCPTCGSLLFGMAEVAADSVSIYVGSLDDPSVFRPQQAMFTRDRYDWDITNAALTEFETMPS
jgi:hypothetical protein